MIEFTSTTTNFDKNDMVKSAWLITPFGWSLKDWTIEDEDDRKIFAIANVQASLFYVFCDCYGHKKECRSIMKKKNINELDEAHKKLYERFQHWVEYVVEGREGICLVKTDDEDGDFDFMEINFHLTKKDMEQISKLSEKTYFDVLKQVEIGYHYAFKNNAIKGE